MHLFLEQPKQEAVNPISPALRLQNISTLKLITEACLINTDNLRKDNDAKNHDITNKTFIGRSLALRHEVTHRKCDIINELNILVDLYDEIRLV